MNQQIDITIPELKSNSVEDLRSYLYQLREKLYVALMLVDNAQKKQQNEVQKAVKSIQNPTSTEKQNTFNQIKELIIKSADIVTSYYDSITNNLSSTYVARSDFGSYTEKIDSIEEKTSTNTTTIINLSTEISNLNKTFTNQFEAYIRTGILDTENEIIGMEIGGKESGIFKKWARFTQNRLSFYDNNESELAYFSNTSMNIGTADIDTLRIGGYEISENADGSISMYWIGTDRKEEE